MNHPLYSKAVSPPEDHNWRLVQGVWTVALILNCRQTDQNPYWGYPSCSICKPSIRIRAAAHSLCMLGAGYVEQWIIC
jgi:hypothetical protein